MLKWVNQGVSMKAFLDMIIKTLPIVLLISCNGAQQAAVEKLTDTTIQNKAASLDAEESEVKIYAISNNQNELGFNLSVECTEVNCKLSGAVYNYSGMEKTDKINFVDSHSRINVIGVLAETENEGVYSGMLRSSDYFQTSDITGLDMIVIYDNNTQTLKMQVKREDSYSTAARCISNSTTVQEEEFNDFINSTTQTFWTNYFESDAAAPLWTACI